ncbi:hypothetical protein N5853_03000 [Bartonella sp. HY329]|uniref:hypothetical protein n=1 Tax=unclassified Bartonella TaxID=2645622 RepID=UPI0021CA8882|nr:MULTISPECIES: hypothetical protein [unclassified Bartonella]UXM95613.1 hypothetical protein N5853_03000 [Bartonella sp. HY329]UXN09938.1 hypothetical protein N5852_03010 [Bartonella sp. HY328]
MADFVGLLKKTIDAQSNMTPQLRQRIYERAKAAVERKLSESPLALEVVNEQRAILQRAIDEVEAYYLAQEGLDELLGFSFDESVSQEVDSVENQAVQLSHENQQYEPPISKHNDSTETLIEQPLQATSPSILPEHEGSIEPSVLPEAPEGDYEGRPAQISVDSQYVDRSLGEGNFNDSADLASQNSSQFTQESHSFGAVNEPAAGETVSDSFVLPIADQHRLSNSTETSRVFSVNSNANEQAQFEEIERLREEERRIAAEQALKQAEERAKFEENERLREEERRIAEEQVLKQAEERAKFEENERLREEERRIAEEQVLKQAEERAKFEENERRREEERRIASEQALKQAEERAKFEENERKREEERRIAEEQALKQAEERAKLEAEQLRLAQEQLEVAKQEELKAEQQAQLDAKAKIYIPVSEAPSDAGLEVLPYADDAALATKAQAEKEDLAQQASEEQLDSKENAVLEVDARLSIEGARTILPRKTENSNFDPSSYRAFDGNLDIAAERDIAGSRKDISRGKNDDIMPMPPLVRATATKAETDSDTNDQRASSFINDDLKLKSDDKSSLKIDDISARKVDDNFDLVSDIFNQSARKEQNRTRSHIGIILFVLVIIIAAATAGVYFYLEGNKAQEASEPTTPPAITDAGGSTGETKPEIITPDVPAVTDADKASLGDEPVVTPPEVADQSEQNSPTTPIADKTTKRLLPDGSEVTAGLSEQGADTGSEGTSLTQATSIAQRSATAKFYERSTSILPASVSPGIVDWKLIRNKGKNDGPDELAVRGDIIIPEKDLTAKITIRPNDDPSINADFLIDLIFIVPENFDGGSVADIGRVKFKAAENSTGQELSGMLSAKVDDNFFVIAVSSNASGSNRNLNLDVMRQFRWIVIPVIYENGRISEFVIDKGDFGDNIFKQVIDDWIAKGPWTQNANRVREGARSTTGGSASPIQNTPSVAAPAPVLLPQNVPVPSTPATVPAPGSVPVPSAPPVQ